jgi:hypothetical protein
MHTDNELIEKQQVLEEPKGTQGGRLETVKLMEMGPVSVETKGFSRGLEMGYTPLGG